jgi:hypothetical protein
MIHILADSMTTAVLASMLTLDPAQNPMDCKICTSTCAGFGIHPGILTSVQLPEFLDETFHAFATGRIVVEYVALTLFLSESPT